MVDPFTIASMGMQAAGGISGMKGGKASAKAAAQAAAFNNQVTGQQNKILAYQDLINLSNIERQAQLTIAVGDIEINRLNDLANAIDGDTKHAASFARLQGRMGIAETKVGFAASGVSTSEGSPLVVRMMQEAMLDREVAEINLQGARMQVDASNQAKAAKFNQQLGLQNLRSGANMQRLSTQMQMQNNMVDAMRNTMQGQATAAQAKAQGTQALLSGLGGAAMTGAKFGMFTKSPDVSQDPFTTTNTFANRMILMSTMASDIGTAALTPLSDEGFNRMLNWKNK